MWNIWKNKTVCDWYPDELMNNKRPLKSRIMRRVFEIIRQNYSNKFSSNLLLQTIEETERNLKIAQTALRWLSTYNRRNRYFIFVDIINHLKVLVNGECTTDWASIVAQNHLRDSISEYCATWSSSFRSLLKYCLKVWASERWNNSTSLFNDPNIHHTSNLRDIWNRRTLARGFVMKYIARMLKISGSVRTE